MPVDAEQANAVDLDWSELPNVRLRPANVCIAQAHPDGHILNFGFAAPPVAPHGEIRPEDVRVQVVARIVMSPGAADSLLSVLKTNIQRRHQVEGG